MGELMTGIACGRALKKLAGMARPLWERCDPMPLRRAIENRYAGGPGGSASWSKISIPPIMWVP